MQIPYYINQDLAITVDLSYSILFQLFLSSLSVFALIIAGYASHSRYSLIGSLRSGVQVLCYELVIGVVSLVVILVTNTLSYSSFIAYHTIIISPAKTGFFIPLFPLYIIFLITIIAETNRAPFDLPEAEAELVSGYNTEYSGVSFSLFFIAEYSNIVALSSIAGIYFFGSPLTDYRKFLYELPTVLIFVINPLLVLYTFTSFIKILLFHIFIFVWIRASFPRYRYDQLMSLC